MDDHIAWLLQQKFFKRALDEAEKHERELKQHSVPVQIEEVTACWKIFWKILE